MDSSYPPLDQVRKSLRVKWYRCPIEREQLRELSKRSDFRGWLQAGGHLALFSSTGFLTYLFWSQELWFACSVMLFAHGTIGSFFVGVAPHELGHGTVFRTKWLNKIFLYLYSLLSWWDPFAYATSHTYHHRYTMYPDGDRENLLPLEPSISSLLAVQLFTVNLFTGQGRTFGKGGLISTIFATVKSACNIPDSTEIPIREWLQALFNDQPSEQIKSRWWSRALLFFHSSIAALAIHTELWVLPLLITVFPFIGNWGVYLVGLPQHCGLRDNDPDFRKCVRSMKLNPLSEFLYWHMNWHTEHHMYAGVPCYNLKKLYRELANDMPTPRTLIGAWKEMRETWQRQQLDPYYQFDTPLPKTAGDQHQEPTDELEYSIGDLAPRGMK